jgi:hypothetical protein
MKRIVLLNVAACSLALCVNAAQIVFDGTSLFSGYTLGFSNAVPAQLLRTLPNSFTITNVAVSGQTGAAMLADFNSQVAPLAGASDAIVFDMFTNDLASEGVDVETAKARCVEYRSRCFAAGFKWVFIRAVSPRSGDAKAFTEANRVAINGWLAETFPTNVYGLDESRIFGPYDRSQKQFTWGNPWFLDSVHLNVDGIALDASALRRKMVEVGFLQFDPPSVAVQTFPGVIVSGAIGNTYRIEAATSLDGAWAEVARVRLTNSTQVWFDDSGAKDRFYRASIGDSALE